MPFEHKKKINELHKKTTIITWLLSQYGGWPDVHFYHIIPNIKRNIDFVWANLLATRPLTTRHVMDKKYCLFLSYHIRNFHIQRKNC